MITQSTLMITGYGMVISCL